MDLLIVEHRADWSHWSHLTRTLRQPVHVLVQLSGESVDQLYARVESRLARPDTPRARRIVALCEDGAREVASIETC